MKRDLTSDDRLIFDELCLASLKNGAITCDAIADYVSAEVRKLRHISLIAFSRNIRFKDQIYQTMRRGIVLGRVQKVSGAGKFAAWGLLESHATRIQ